MKQYDAIILYFYNDKSKLIKKPHCTTLLAFGKIDYNSSEFFYIEIDINFILTTILF